MRALVAAGCGLILKGAAKIDEARDFMHFFMQPKVMNENLQGGPVRRVPVIPSVVREDRYWTDTNPDPLRLAHVTEAVLSATAPNYDTFNPAWGQANAEQIRGVAHADVITNGMKVA